MLPEEPKTTRTLELLRSTQEGDERAWDRLAQQMAAGHTPLRQDRLASTAAVAMNVLFRSRTAARDGLTMTSLRWVMEPIPYTLPTFPNWLPFCA